MDCRMFVDNKCMCTQIRGTKCAGEKCKYRKSFSTAAPKVVVEAIEEVLEVEENSDDTVSNTDVDVSEDVSESCACGEGECSDCENKEGEDKEMTREEFDTIKEDNESTD